MLLVDLSKAFDCLPHSLTVAKLRAYGISQNATAFLADYLTSRRQRVKVGSSLSDWIAITKGIPQGSIMGPIIFNIFINDIFSAIKDGTLFNYADDNTVLISAESVAGAKAKLKNECDNIVNWVKQNDMQANAQKFQVMLSINETDDDVFNLSQDVYLPCENHVKLLGVTLDQKLNFNEHISLLCVKASKQINVLSRFRRILDVQTKLLLYKSFIQCHFNYCPLVWHSCGITNTKRMERLQYRALRFVFSDFNSPYEVLLSKAKMPTLELSRMRSIANEVFKAINNISPPFICDMFANSHPTHSYNLRNNNLKNNHCRTTHFGLHSFKHISINIWNSLPSEIRTSSDFSTFNRFIRSWSGPTCKCSLCKHIV